MSDWKSSLCVDFHGRGTTPGVRSAPAKSSRTRARAGAISPGSLTSIACRPKSTPLSSACRRRQSVSKSPPWPVLKRQEW